MVGEDRIYRVAINLWGEEFQIDMMIEEMAELTKAFLKLRRAKLAGKPREEILKLAGHVVEEMADVQIMMNQMTTLFGNEPFMVVYRMKYKRLENKVEKAKKEDTGYEESLTEG
jgi:hypothetical protein